MFEFITVSDAAKLTGLDESQIRRDLRSGRIKGQLFNNVWLVSRISALKRKRDRAPKRTRIRENS